MIDSLFYELKVVWDVHSAGDLVMCLGGLNGQVDCHIYRFHGVQRGYGIGQRNLEGRMLLVLSEKELCVSNAWFKSVEKMEFTHLAHPL